MIRDRSILRPFRFAAARLALSAAVFFVCGWAIPAGAEDRYPSISYPSISGEIVIEVQNDGTYRSDNADNERTNLFTDTEPYVRLGLTPEFTVHLHGVLDQVRDPEPNEDRFFDDQGMYVEALFLEYATDRYAVSAGKLPVDFGRAWDVAPGIYGSEFAEDGYEFSERIGINGAVTADLAELGPQTLSGGAFFADTSPLNQSFPADRGSLSWDDGGVGDTGKPNNWSLALGSDELLNVEGLAYHLGLLHQARGRDSETSEKGYAAALSLPVHLGADIRVTPFAEWVRLSDHGGVDGARQTFATGSVLAEWHGWNLAFSHTTRDTRSNEEGSALTDTLTQVSAGYAFDFGLGIDLGWKLTDEEAIETRTIGALLSYTLEF